MSEEPTRGHSFDELARSLAEGSISRRRALKLFAGTAIAALIPSRAMAADDNGCTRICHIPQRADGTCKRSEADTRCVDDENLQRHLRDHDCDCVGSCASTDKCRNTTSTTTTQGGTTSTTTTRAATTSTTTTAMCKGFGQSCDPEKDCCSGNLVCRGGTRHPERVQCRNPLDT